AVKAKVLVSRRFGEGLRKIPLALATSMPSSITLSEISRSSVVLCSSPFLTRAIAAMGLIAEFTMVFAQSTPWMLLLIAVGQPAARKALPISTHLSESLHLILPSAASHLRYCI